MINLKPAMEAILRSRAALPLDRSVLVAISGIDASGKGYICDRLATALRSQRMRTAVVNVDGWLRLPQERFTQHEPGEHFYRNAIRFDELFADLVLPLRHRRTHRVTMDYVGETATRTRSRTYEFEDVDVILLEGIFLLKQHLRGWYDLSVWIDCGFATALERAIARAQEGLSAEATIRAYRTIYFPAQAIHLMRDRPREAATMIVNNDHAGDCAVRPRCAEDVPC